MKRTLTERFENFIMPEPNTGCWLWTGSLSVSGGYGEININQRAVKAHRLSYELHIGEIPPGMFICHHCDVPMCVNPDHLFAGTPLDNVIDMYKKGRENNLYGMNHKNSKLTEDDVRRIMIDCKKGIKQKEVAKKFNVCKQYISAIMCGKAWKHIPMIEFGSSDDYPIIPQ